ncbi:MAG TPA: GH25 family lysozyme [Myxococcota bacterium]|jgi:GH25 family lysozyme M1 (1,4-beta-N-acetylmuramidase)
MRRPLIVSLAFISLIGLVASCAREASLDDDKSSDEQAQTVCAGATTFGVDVSEFQGNIDWGTAAANGVAFAVIRVGDGFYDDPKFTQNWNNAGGAGVLRGAYQFFRAGDDPTNEANHFADILMANGGPGEIPPVADVEVSDGVDAGTYAAHLATWLQVVEARTGQRPMIYTGKYFWQDNVGGADDTAYPLWVAQWGPSCPDIPNPWGNWQFWQTHDDGQVAGIPATVDTDVYNGDINALRALSGDPQCLANPDTGGCNGSVVTSCDQTNHLGTGDCGFFGATCSTEGGHPHCVHPYCTANLNGAEDGTFCADNTHLDTCALGQLTSGDCAAYGATCVNGHCDQFQCWTNLNGADNGTFCDGTQVATCVNGVFSEGDCAAYGGECGTEGGTAHCIHYMCWSNLNGAEDGSFCKDANTLGSCAVGAYNETDCTAQGGCTATATGAQCGAPPPSGEGEGSVGEGEGDVGEGPGDVGEGEGEGTSTTPPIQTIPSSCAATGDASVPLASLVLFVGAMRAVGRRRRRA